MMSDGFLDTLRSREPLPAASGAAALAGVAATALVGMVARGREGSAETGEAHDEVEGVGDRLKGFLAKEQYTPEDLIGIAHESLRVIDLAAKILPEAAGRSNDLSGVLSAAVALARAAAEGAIHIALAQAAGIPGDVDRVAVKTRADTSLQQVRRAEADFTRVAATESGRP